MEILMKPFIIIYHAVSKVFNLPAKLLGKTEDAVIGYVDQSQLKKENAFNDLVVQEIPETLEDNFSGISNKSLNSQKQKKELLSFRYRAINAVGKKETSLIDAESESDARTFLEGQDYQILSLELKKSYDIEIGGNGKLKAVDLSFALTQLSTYIKAGIPLIDSVRILAKQSTKPGVKRAFERLVYDLLKGENLSTAMEHQDKRFPKLLINMVKTAEMTGDLPTILDDMADYYTSIERTRKQMISAMTYPSIVFLLAIGVLVFMLLFLVPQFVHMFESQSAELPRITLMVMNASDFLRYNYLVLLLIVVVIVVTFVYLYKKVIPFRMMIQKMLMHIPVIGNIIIYKEVSNFTKTFASLINHGVFITDSMEILSKITNNEIYKKIINNSLRNLGKGESISTAFKGEWAFPIVAYEMLVTGENTGQLGLMMEKVADHYQSLHKNLIDQLKGLIEPVMIVLLAGIVGVILVSIVVPMFTIYDAIQ